MKIERIKDAVIKKLWFILLITIVCTGLTAFVSVYLITPIYEAQTSLYVYTKDYASTATQDQTAYSDIQVNQMLIKDYAQLLTSEKVTSQVINRLGIKGMSADDLSGELSISNQNSTDILTIYVDDSSPLRAQQIANAVGDVFVDTVLELTNKNNISTIDSAKLPTHPIQPQKTKNVLLSFLISLFGSTGIVAFVEVLDNRAKSIEDIEDEVGFNVIGILPQMGIK